MSYRSMQEILVLITSTNDKDLPVYGCSLRIDPRIMTFSQKERLLVAFIHMQ